MDFKISIREDGVISVIDPKIMTAKAAELIGNDMEQCIKKLRPRGRPVLILIDAHPLEVVEPHVNKTIVQRTIEMDFDRLAVFGTSPMNTKAVNLMIIAAYLVKQKGPIGKIKVFVTQAEAEKWLKKAHAKATSVK